MKLTKTQMAFSELSTLLNRICEDNHLTESEFREILLWRAKWRTVVRRDEIKPFDDWLNMAISDGEIDATEKQQLFDWAVKISDEHESMRFSPESFESGSAYLSAPPAIRRSWGEDEATAKQIAFLISLGEKEERCQRLSKQDASARIDELLDEKRRSKEKANEGISLSSILIVIIIAYLLFKSCGKG